MSNSSGSLRKKRKSTVLPRSTVDYLKTWMMSPEHVSHPYPTEKEKVKIMADTGIELKQLTNWFVNNRKRFWKPRVEARLQQQLQAHKAVSMTGVNNTRSIAHMTTGIFANQPVDCVMTFNPPTNAVFSRSISESVTPDFQFNKSSNKEDNESRAQPSFQIITNHTTFVPPCPAETNSLHHCHSQVVSMGSASYSSDSECNNSLSNISQDDHENSDTLVSFDEEENPPSRKKDQCNSPLRKRHIILGSAIAHTLENIQVQNKDRKLVSPSVDGIKLLPTTSKRSRSNSDSASFSSCRNIICRPRSLTAIDVDGADEGSPKRRFVEGWQNACRSARHSYDTCLPTMEEAVLLFGFAQME